MRRITESFQMRKNINREDNGLKRRISDEEQHENITAVTGISPSDKIKSCPGRRRLPVESPVLQSQKEIYWSTVSPDCHLRLQPRVFDESKIQEDVAATINSYVILNKKPKPPECGILDTWLNKSEVVFHPPTPKSSHESRQIRSRDFRQRQALSAMKLILESANSSNLSNKNECSTSNMTATDNSKDSDKSGDNYNDCWEEDELFNNVDFLTLTQQLESKYLNKKSSVPKEKCEAVASTSKDVKLAVSSHSSDDEPCSKREKKEENINEELCGDSNSVLDSLRPPVTANNVLDGADINVNPSSFNIPKTLSVKHLVSDDEDDEIDKIMCKLECPSNSQLDNCLAPTQILDFTECNKQQDETVDKTANNSFVFDSDDSFGADFDL